MMRNEILVTGMVLLGASVNDYDKRLVILTRERGKITVFAKGAKKPRSAFVAGSRPFCFGTFTIYEGRTAYNLISMDIQNYFEEITMDMDVVYYGFYFLEMAEYFTTENMRAEQELLLLYQSLRALKNNRIDNRLVQRIYELKMLAIHGEYPNVFSCMYCGREEQLDGYSPSADGMVCGCCSCGDKIKLLTSTVYTMQYIITAEIGKLYTFCVKPEVLQELGMVLNRFMQKHVGKEFNSLEMLKTT